MRMRIPKVLCLFALLLCTTGATWPPLCSMGCAARTAEVVLGEIQPPGGPISGGTVTLTLTGTEEHTVAASYGLSAWLSKWNPQTNSWQSVGSTPSWQYGTWTQSGTCSEIRNITITFANVPLTSGENKFQITCLVDGWDGMDDQWVYREVTYTH